MLQASLIATICYGLGCLATSASDAQLKLQGMGRSNTKPNIVFILTDDQDVRLDSLAYLPNLQRHLIRHGTVFERHYCTVALCCPSRVNLWTGKAAHNTNVTDVNPPYGESLYILLGFALSPRSMLIISKVDIPNSSVRDSTKPGCLFGCRRPVITPIIRENCSMLTQSATMTLLSQLGSLALISFLILTLTST